MNPLILIALGAWLGSSEDEPEIEQEQPPSPEKVALDIKTRLEKIEAEKYPDKTEENRIKIAREAISQIKKSDKLYQQVTEAIKELGPVLFEVSVGHRSADIVVNVLKQS
ncbi:MAG: hypothetical protein ACFBSC_22455 [Microcoleaceae cyanobacterium]